MRKTYIDNIRWITVVLVVLYHVIYMFNGEATAGVVGPLSEFQPQDIYQYIVYPWFMLLLFAVSGMAARYELEGKDSKQFMKDRTRKLLVPSTIGLLVFEWILGYYNMYLSGAFYEMKEMPVPVLYLIMSLSGTGVLWYVQMLWLFSILLLLVRKIEKDKLYELGGRTNIIVLLAMTLLIYGAAQILNTPVILVYRFGIYGVGFFIGYFVLSHDEVQERLEKYRIMLTVLAIVSCVAFCILYWGKPYPEHEVIDTVMCNAYAWLGTLGVLAFMKKWGNFENTFSKWMCKKSWGLYVFHYLPLAVSAWYLRLLCPDMPAIFVYLLVAVSAFAGAFVLYEVISRIPVIRWCVLGIKNKKEK